MALLIDTSISIMGLTTNQLYLRLNYSADIFGKTINCSINPYFNKAAFISSYNENVLRIPGLKTSYTIYYDRKSDGIDLLTIIHDVIKKELSTDVYRKVTTGQSDPSTGQLLLDPLTNQPYVKDVLVKAKLADAKNIKIIDLD